MTNGKKCACKWDENDEVVSFCGAHTKLHNKLTESLIEDRAMLEYIKVYAKHDHPILTSRACPLCQWETEQIENGMWVGKHKTPCTYHYALNQLYALKVEGREDIWNLKENAN